MKAYHRFSLLVTVLAILSSRSALADSLAPNSSVQPSRVTTSLPNLVACSPDGKFYVFATPDGRIGYARTDDGVVLHTFYHCNPQSVVFSPDGDFLASAGKSCGGRTKLKIWNLAKGTLICQMTTHVGRDVLLSFSPDRKWLASTSAGSCIDIWELPDGILKQSVKTPRAVSHIAFSEQSQSVVAVWVDGSARTYSVL